MGQKESAFFHLPLDLIGPDTQSPENGHVGDLRTDVKMQTDEFDLF